jgi:hypothetical protein
VIEKLQQSHPKIYKHFFTVTTFSKLIALSMFIILPFVGFYLGTRYQQVVTVANTLAVSEVQKTVIPTSTPISTSAWKTFENDKFTIKYPPDWQVQITPLIGNRAPVFLPTGQDYPVLDVGYSTLQDYIIPCKENGLSQSRIIVDGTQAIECTGTTKTVKRGIETNITAQWRTVEIDGKNNKFSFNYKYSSDQPNEYYENLFITFLNTFQTK